jgi:hypothetical protein
VEGKSPRVVYVDGSGFSDDVTVIGCGGSVSEGGRTFRFAVLIERVSTGTFNSLEQSCIDFVRRAFNPDVIYNDAQFYVVGCEYAYKGHLRIQEAHVLARMVSRTWEGHKRSSKRLQDILARDIE